MCLAFAYAYGNGNAKCNGVAYCYRGTENYSCTEAASHAAASTVRPGFNGIVFLRGLANIASPRNAYGAFLNFGPTVLECQRAAPGVNTVTWL